MTTSTESIHDLFARVKAHPDYLFGTIFVTKDLPVEKLNDLGVKWGEEALVAAGAEYIENLYTN